MRFVALGQDAEITGNIELGSADQISTEIRYSIEIIPISAIGKTALTLLGKDTVKKQTSDFAKCIKAKLERSIP
jgi:hypothetical protein